MKAYTAQYDEIVLRTKVYAFNNNPLVTDGGLNYYTDDSMMAVEREVWEYPQAKSLGLDQGNG